MYLWGLPEARAGGEQRSWEAAALGLGGCLVSEILDPVTEDGAEAVVFETLPGPHTSPAQAPNESPSSGSARWSRVGGCLRWVLQAQGGAGVPSLRR